MEKDNKFNNLFIVSMVMAAITVYISIALGKNINDLYFWGISSSIILLMLGLVARSKSIFYKNLKQVRENYGKENKRERKFEDIKLLFDVLKYKNSEEIYVDDQTYLDLNMDEVFGKLDRTLCSPGEQYLYYILRNPVLKVGKLINRNKIVSFFQHNKEIREKVQISLLKLGRQRSNTITCFLWNEISYKTSMKPLLYLLTILAFASLASIAFIGISKAFVFIFVIFAANSFLSFKIKKQVGSEIQSMRYLGKLISMA